jgi:hypothetical protein
VWALFEQALAQFGPRHTIVEWDADLPALQGLLDEVARAHAGCSGPLIFRVRNMAALREIQLDVMQVVLVRAHDANTTAHVVPPAAAAAERHVRPGVLAPRRRAVLQPVRSSSSPGGS